MNREGNPPGRFRTPPRPITSCFVALVFGAIITMSLAADPNPAGREDPADVKRIEEEMKLLNETPVGKEIADLNAKLNASYQAHDKERQALQEKMSKIRETDAYKEYEKKRQELDRQRSAAGETARKALADAARQLYEARHAELRKLTTKDRANARRLGFDVLTYPRLDGSTSTHPLSVIIASQILGTAYEWIYPEPSGHPWASSRPSVPPGLYLSGMEMPASASFRMRGGDMEFNISASRTVAKPQQPGQERVVMMINSLLATSSTTHDAWVNLIEGRCDLNLTARPMSADESKLARDKGVKIEMKPIALDALVFIVNEKNPVQSIASRQIQQIYRGEIKSWTELGGDAKDIRALWRDRNSGSRELFDALVSGDQPIPEPDNVRMRELFSNSMSGPFNRVTQDAQALGYSIYYYEHFMALSPRTRMIAIDGVEPTPKTIASRKYPYVSEVYAAYRAGEPAGSPAMKLLAWLLSAEGQSVVRESGYVTAEK